MDISPSEGVLRHRNAQVQTYDVLKQEVNAEDPSPPTRPSGFRTYIPRNARDALSDAVLRGTTAIQSLPWSYWFDETRWWMWKKRYALLKVIMAIFAVFLLFFIIHTYNTYTMSQEEYRVYMYGEEATHGGDHHLSSREVIQQVKLSEASITPSQFPTYADVDTSLFKACVALTADDFASGLVMLDIHTRSLGERIDSFLGEEEEEGEEEEGEVDHVIVTLQEIRETNERLLKSMVDSLPEEEQENTMMLMIPKFWNVTSPEVADILKSASFNPCVLSVRLPGGMVVTMYNPVATNHVYTTDDSKYKDKTMKRVDADPEDVFPFWDRIENFYKILRLRYNEWPSRSYDKPTITDFRGVESIFFQIYLQYLSAEGLFEAMMASRT